MERHSAYKTAGAPTYTTGGSEREIAILRLLARYDLLPSDFIYHALGKYEATRKALTLLAKGHYIGLPDLSFEEKLVYIPRNGYYVFEIKPRGRALLAKYGDIFLATANDHYKHRLLRSQIEFLFDRGPFIVKRPEDILADKRCPDSTRDAAYPFRIERPKLEPDITRGFEDQEHTLFVHIEVDRGTEPVASKKDRQNLKSKVDRYAEYFAIESYKTHFGFVYPPSVLFITTRPNIDALVALFPEKWRKRFYALSIDPKLLPTSNLIVPWQGVDGTLNLMELLHERPREGREGGAALEGDTGAGSGTHPALRRDAGQNAGGAEVL